MTPEELQTKYDALDAQVVGKLVEAAKAGQLKINKANVDYTKIEVYALTAQGDVVAEKILPFSDFESVEWLCEGPGNLIGNDTLAEFFTTEADYIITPILTPEQIARVDRVEVQIGDRTSDGQWDDFQFGFVLPLH
jgi:hypothetical protein